MKKKKIFVLFASPHKNGNTAVLLKYFLKNYSEYEIIIFDIYNKEVKPCVDCGYCKVNDCCRYNDFDEIDKYLNIADMLVVATPSYNLSFPAPLKAVFDRTQVYFVKRFFNGVCPPIKKKKEAVLLLTTGSDSELSKDIITKQLNMIFTIINAKLSKILVLENTDNINFDKDRISDYIKRF